MLFATTQGNLECEHALVFPIYALAGVFLGWMLGFLYDWALTWRDRSRRRQNANLEASAHA